MNTILFVGELPKTFDVRWHTHDQWELVYCTSGQGAFPFTSGAVIAYQTGEAVVIPPGVLHANSSAGGFTNIYITMAEPSFSQKQAFRVGDDDIQSLKSAFCQARYYYVSDLQMRELILASLGDLIAGYLTVFQTNAAYSAPVEQIRTSITRNFSHPDYALNQMIHSMPFNYDYLRKLFKKEVGMSPLEYMTNLRMKNAEMLLSAMWANDYTVAEIAQMCGFEDALYFSRVFKKHFGCSPSCFGKRHGQIQRADPGCTGIDAEAPAGSGRP